MLEVGQRREQLPRLVVIGAGGHAGVLIAALKRAGTPPFGCVDPDRTKWRKSLLGIPVLGGDEQLDELRHGAEVQLVNAIGYTRDPAPRREIWERFQGTHRFAIVRDPTAFVDDSAVLGEGAQVLAVAIVQTGARIGENTIINTGAQVDHDCRIGAHAHVAPGAILSGDVSVGDAALIGAGAVIKHGVSIGRGAVIGMGAVVLRDVADGMRVAGVPARPIT